MIRNSLGAMRGGWSVPRVVFLAGLAAACTTTGTPLPDPYTSPRSHQVVTSLRALVVTPTTVAEDIEVPDSALAAIDVAVERQLITAGFEVVAAAEYQRIWMRILRQMGGFFDPVSGERDGRRFARARGELLREVRARYGTDVLIYPELVVVDVEVRGGVARWDGAQHDLRASGRIDTRFLATFDPDRYFGADGVISAVSLLVSVDAADGVQLFESVGGLEVIRTMGVTSDSTDARLGIVADPTRIERAVSLALDRLERRSADSLVTPTDSVRR